VHFFFLVWNFFLNLFIPQRHTHISWLSSNVTSYQRFLYLLHQMSCSPSFSLYSTYTNHFALQLNFYMPIPAIMWPFQEKGLYLIYHPVPNVAYIVGFQIKACRMVGVIRLLSVNNKCFYNTYDRALYQSVLEMLGSGKFLF
jgi:hypothetical protein